MRALRVSTAALARVSVALCILLSGSCALSPLGSERVPGPIDAADGGDGDDADDDESEVPARRDSGVRDAGTKPADAGRKGDAGGDGSLEPPIKDAGVARPADSGVARDAGSTNDAGVADSGRSPPPEDPVDSGPADAGIGSPLVLQCQSAAQCAPSTCPAFGVVPCCRADGVCTCRALLSACR